MDDHRPDSSVDRKEFLRRSGALGIAGATALGFPLLETRIAGASPLLPPRDVIAAGGGATVKIGHIDGFSGVYAAASQSQHHGMEVAVAEAMKKNSRIKYELLKGDDASAAATGTTEAKRLIQQEKVDLLTGCLSSAVGLAVSATAQQNNVLFLAIGTHDTNITGPKAHRVTFRQTCSNAMLANAVGPELLKSGKKWYFLVADYAFGTDARDRFKKILLAHGGQVVGEDLHKLGETDYSSYLTKARNTDANVLVFCNYGPDCQNATKAAVQLGLNKKMKFGGILSGNDVAVGMPVDDIVGSIWGYVWGPEAGGDAPRVYAALKPGVPAVDWRQYLGYMAATNIINRLNAAGTTETEKVIEAFENYHYNAAKKSGAYFRKCDHQAIQQTYAGVIVAKNKRRSEGEYFTIGATVGGEYAAEPCSNPDSVAAEKIITSEKVGPREGYTVVSTK
ncbi:MAG: branched-chain amino acid transport system substrate-binding protein [Candidatus Eremiobacteraeota bacterium]|jgi:branched-chain amino acid transport system substrate-binding protein|nr:branched-chain amino acid transport system substrate-binding protein [Candidatus Eremiobacteraeota bacterium]